MLQGTSATARRVGGRTGQTRSALVISPATGGGLVSFPVSQLPAASSPRIAAGGGYARGWSGKRVHRRIPTVQSRLRRACVSALLGSASACGAAFWSPRSTGVRFFPFAPRRLHCALSCSYAQPVVAAD